MQFVEQLRKQLAFLSPARQKWLHFLRSLEADPDAWRGTLEDIGQNDFVICGVPRSGTTLLCGMLFQPPQCYTVMEPWDGMRMQPKELFESLRCEIKNGSLSRGKLDVAKLTSEKKVVWCKEGSSQTSTCAPDSDYCLGIKWPAFWRYLEHLKETKFLVCVRDPLHVVQSFERHGGRLEEGLMYDTRFNREMNDYLTRFTNDHKTRRYALYEYINKRILKFQGQENVMLIKYEEWFQDPDRLLSRIGRFLGCEFPSLPVKINDNAEQTNCNETRLGLAAQCPSVFDGPYADLFR